MGFDYFRNWCHGGDRDLHDYRDCNREFSWSSLDHFDCDCGFCVGLSALFFAEFASRIPSTGGAYSYLYAIFGEFPAWIAGWLTVMEFMTAVSGVASGWAAYFKGLLANLGWSLPTALNGTFDPAKGTYVDLLPIWSWSSSQP